MCKQFLLGKKSTTPVLLSFFLFGAIFFVFVGGAVAQTNLPPLQNSVKPNPAPAPPGDAFLPVMTGTAPANAPQIAEYTRTAGADESIVMTGTGFSRYSGIDEGKDSRF